MRSTVAEYDRGPRLGNEQAVRNAAIANAAIFTGDLMPWSRGGCSRWFSVPIRGYDKGGFAFRHSLASTKLRIRPTCRPAISKVGDDLCISLHYREHKSNGLTAYWVGIGMVIARVVLKWTCANP